MRQFSTALSHLYMRNETMVKPLFVLLRAHVPAHLRLHSHYWVKGC